MGDDRQLRRKPFEVFGFPAEVAFRDQQGEVGVLVAGVFDAAVEFGL